METEDAVQPPNETYGVFAGDINDAAVDRFFRIAAFASECGASRVHALVQSGGGAVGSGICLYNFFRTSPVPFTLYNTGALMSIAAVAYLGSADRRTSAYAVFGLHRTSASPQSAHASTLRGFAESVELDDKRIEAILREHLTITDILMADLARPGIGKALSGEEAVRIGLALTIGDFAPPPGTRLFQI